MPISPDDEMPNFIYGTAWKEDQTRPLTRLALEAGFRAIDTANQRKHYHEAGVGEAVAEAIDEGTVTRDELFLQTKFTHLAGQGDHVPYDVDAPYAEQVEQSFDSSLQHLQTDYLDAYLLHGPTTRSGWSEADREVWEAMETLAETGRAETIGVSNVSADQLETLVDWADHPPEWVQNRCFARSGWDAATREICATHDLVYQGFSLLTANAGELRDPEVADIAERHDRTLPEIVFRFATQIDILPLTGTTDERHMHQDLSIFEFELDDRELETLLRIAI